MSTWEESWLPQIYDTGVRQAGKLRQYMYDCQQGFIRFGRPSHLCRTRQNIIASTGSTSNYNAIALMPNETNHHRFHRQYFKLQRHVEKEANSKDSHGNSITVCGCNACQDNSMNDTGGAPGQAGLVVLVQ